MFMVSGDDLKILIKARDILTRYGHLGQHEITDFLRNSAIDAPALESD